MQIWGYGKEMCKRGKCPKYFYAFGFRAELYCKCPKCPWCEKYIPCKCVAAELDELFGFNR